MSKTALVSGQRNEYDHIELTQDEIDQAIYSAKKAKHFVIKNREYGELIKKESPGLKLDAENMLKFIVGKARHLQIKFSVNEFNLNLVTELCKYFTGDPTGTIDQSKGLMLFGNVGQGKTSLIQLFNENQVSSYRVATCKVIADKFKKAGNDADDVVREYSSLRSMASLAHEFKNGDKLGICFDDLGTEDEVKNYGNQSNVMSELILRCYDNKLMKGKVHITTNLTRKQIEEYYGDRVVSRMQEMFNEIIIPIETPDYRKL